MIKTIALVSTIVALISIAAFVGQQSRPQICIKSPLVERLDIVAHGLAKSLRHCGDEWSLSEASPVQRKWIQKLDNDAREMTRIGQIAQLQPPQGISVRIHLDRPYLWSVSPQRIDLGIDTFESKGQLLRALVVASLKRMSSPALRESQLGTEILADQILILVQGEIDVVDPLTGRSTDSPWPLKEQLRRSVQTEAMICTSPWKLGISLNSCPRKGQSIAAESVRGYVALETLALVQEAAMMDKRRQLQRTVRLAHTMDVPVTSVETIEDVAALSAQYIQVLWQRDPEMSWYPKDLKLLIEAESQNSNLIEEFEFESNPSAVVMSGGKVQFYPGGPFLATRMELPVPAHRVRIVKKYSNVGKLSQMSSKDDRVLEILESQKFSLKNYVEFGPKSFVKSNPDLKFAIFHLPSIRLAIGFGLAESTILGKGTSRLTERFSKLLGPDPESKEDKSHYNQSPVSAMEWYHF